MVLSTYRGRFAPSPTGLLHIGSLVTALASWLDAKASNGKWIVRIEDVDYVRSEKNAALGILQQLAVFGLTSDEPILYQSQRATIYQKYLEKLHSQGCVYACGCSRKKILSYYEELGMPISPHDETIYPGFCRGEQRIDESSFVQRILIPDNTWIDSQRLDKEVGDFVLRRADGIYSYQLAVVVDDQLQGISHIVRGADLASNTPRQKYLQQLLGFSTPKYLHIPVVMDHTGNKLSKQTGAQPLWPKTTKEILDSLKKIAKHLNLEIDSHSTKTIPEWQQVAIQAWRNQQKFR